MSESERIMQMARDSHAALFGIRGDASNIGLVRQFDIFKTEVVTTIKAQTGATDRSNNRMNMIIAGLGLLVACGILLCAILGIALTHRDARTMLMSNHPFTTASSDAAMPYNP